MNNNIDEDGLEEKMLGEKILEEKVLKEKVLEDYTPREYQSLLLEKCKSNNTILYLPTGSGKTYIAVMLIKHMSHDIITSFKNGGKRTFFMVNTVALAGQQAEYISRHTHLTVKHFTGDMNVDYWTKEIWLEHLNENQVLVMTCQIFLDILLHSYINLQCVNLLIFDECHHAVNDHSMRQVMKLFDHCSVEEQPRVLGLTATLLNSNCKLMNVQSEVETLERTYRSKVATLEDLSEIQGFSTNPTEELRMFPVSGLNSVINKTREHIEKCKNFIMDAAFECDKNELNSSFPDAQMLKDPRKVNRKLKNIMEDVMYHIETLGIYGGSLAALKHLIQLERIRTRAEDAKTMLLYQALITSLNMIRKLLEDEMSDCSEQGRIIKYSTSKVWTLIKVLKDFKPKETNLHGIVFVERRFTAKVMYLILKALSEHDGDFCFIKADFIVGYQNNPFNNTREGALEKQWNSEALYRFNRGHTNILVSSDVLEEGIDIQRCNMVVRFDLPKSYRSYVQSKGRARHKSSSFILLIPESDRIKYESKFIEYQKVEKKLKNILVRRDDADGETGGSPTTEINRIYCGGGNSKVTMNSAIALINRYCAMLPQDKFTKLVPNFYLRSVNGKSQCILQLPINSSLKDVIMGEAMPNKKLAKQIVALQTCQTLHEAGQLDEDLLPRGSQADPLESEELFIMYKSDEQLKPNDPQPGTKKRKQHYKKEHPSSLTECTPQPGMPVYLHVIEQMPVYERPSDDDSRKLAFYNLLEAFEGFAILSSKKLPLLCDFSIFLNVGEVEVNVKSNYEELCFTAEEILKLQNFNILIFDDLLKLVKVFTIVDLENKENSFFIVPTTRDLDGKHRLDWDVVNAHPTLPSMRKPSDDARTNLQVTREEFHHAVIVPWYRGSLPDQMYVVTKICSDMSPLSPFPTRDFDSFKEYYTNKYKLDIKSIDQPLVEVKAISSKINCLKSRTSGVSQSTSKRKRQELQEDFEEHLIPELCFRYKFPAVLWLKATCLPSILHRIDRLLIAEELRVQIAKDLAFQPVEGIKWDQLIVDQSCMEEEDNHKLTPHSVSGINILMSKMRVNEGTGLQSTKMQLWGDEKEPFDIDRERLEDLTFMDIMYYDDFISKPITIECGSSPAKANSKPSDGNCPPSSPTVGANLPTDQRRIPLIHVLQVKQHGIGPQQHQVMQALMSASANDVVNLERLETLGDSLLKFCSSLFLFLYYPQVDEGKLTQIKGKMVGNRNLYYCGKARRLGSIMKVYDFNPKSDWIPPGFCVPRKLQMVLQETGLSPTFLYKVDIPYEEQHRGVLSPSTLDAIENQLMECEDENNHSTMEVLIGLQSVPDKVIADCVEALIGTYLLGYGLEGAVKMLGWLYIIPPDKGTPEWLLKNPAPTAFVNKTFKQEDIARHLPDIEVEDIEKRLDYHFRDRSYLLQALTHASYTQNRLTDCYQRLEFLGDAILDFLITCHIYETCDNLSPGDLTDLRSALVNNITFGSLAVRHNIHKYCKYESSKLFDKVDTFVKFQEENHHKVSEDVLFLLSEDDCQLAESVDVPKVLGDLFESLAGAIYLDSGKSLNEVWRVYYNIMKREIHEFSRCVPKQPVRVLYEKCQPAPVFLKGVPVQDGKRMMVELEIVIANKKCRYYGFGENKFSAKRAAAKLALKDL